MPIVNRGTHSVGAAPAEEGGDMGVRWLCWVREREGGTWNTQEEDTRRPMTFAPMEEGGTWGVREGGWRVCRDEVAVVLGEVQLIYIMLAAMMGF